MRPCKSGSISSDYLSKVIARFLAYTSVGLNSYRALSSTCGLCLLTMSNPEIIISESETAPLLRNRLATEEEEPPQLDEPTVPRPKRETLRAIILIYAITLLCDFAGYFAYAPQLQIFEDIICRDHYTALGQWNAGEPLEPSRCKTPAVQAELALLNGWKDTLEIIPGMYFL